MSYVFLSHSQIDKPFVHRLASDLIRLGHKVWMDEISINIGDNIAKEIQKGIRECDFLIFVASKSAMTSNWVEIEWIAEFWKGTNSGKTNILPILIEDCELPIFLQNIRFADFRNQYETGLAQLHNRLISDRILDSSEESNYTQITIRDNADSDEIAELLRNAILSKSYFIKISFEYEVKDIVSPSLNILRDAIIRAKHFLVNKEGNVVTICVGNIQQEYVSTFFSGRPLPKGFILCGS